MHAKSKNTIDEILHFWFEETTQKQKYYIRQPYYRKISVHILEYRQNGRIK